MITVNKKTSYILLLLTGIVILILALLPSLIKDYAINNSKELIGRKIAIGKLKYNYFSSTVKVYDFKMFEVNEKDHFTTFDTLILNLEPIKLFVDKIEIEQFYLKGLLVKTIMKDSTFNFDDLIAFHSEPTDSLSTEEPKPFKYSIENIEVKESNFYFDDKNVDKETHIEDLSFSIPKIGWDQEEKSNAHIKFNFKSGGYLESSFNVNPSDGEFDAFITIKDLYLNPFYQYVVEYAEINDFKGHLNSQIKIEGNTNEAVNSIVTGHIDINDFLMTDTSDKEFLKANRIDINLKNLDYANSSYILDSLKVTRPYSLFKMDSITNNFFEIFKLDRTDQLTNEKIESAETPDTVSNSNLYYAINHFIIQNGSVDYSDNLTGEQFDYNISEINMTSDSIFSDSKRVFVNANMILNNKGILQAEVGLNPIDGEFDALVSVKDLDLKPFYQYVIEYAEINDFNGRVNSKIEINGNTNEPINSIVSGHVDVNDFVMTDANNKEFLKANRVDFNMKKVDYSNSYYDLDSLKLSQPYAYFEMDSITNNFFKIFKIEAESEVNESDSDIYYVINHLILKDGILDYSDNLTGERFDYHLSKIEVDSESILSDSNWVNINSDMLLNNRGTLHSELGLNPSDYNNLNLDLTIENFLLSDINIYSNYYTGHNILEGDFYYYSQSKITNGAIESENQLLVKKVSVSNEEGGLYALPLRFALFLLKDKNGDVNLEVPVRGDLNDPEVSVGKIVWNTFKNLIVKTAASPINFLAGLVDGDPKEFEEFKFSYTDTIPSEKQFRKLDKLLEMETKKEGLKIEMIHYVDPKLQQEAIVFSELGKQYFQETKKDYLKDEKDFESFVRTKIGNDSIAMKDAAYTLVKPQTADSLATRFNIALMRNTTEYLKSIKPNTNIVVNRAELKEPSNIGSLNKFKIKYDMLDEKTVQSDTINTKV